MVVWHIIYLQVAHISYDNNGRLLREEFFPDDYKDWYDYSYDSNGNLIVKTWSDNDEGILEKASYVYTDNILTQEVWENYADGNLEGKVIYTYVKGNVAKIVESGESGEIEATWSYQYKYDSRSNWIEQIVTADTVDKEEIFIIERKIEYYQ